MLWLLAVVLLVILVHAPRAEAHLAGEGTSDGPDPGQSIELYKEPGTYFEGRFARAREHFNRVPGVPNFEMVRTRERAEVYVYAYTDTACRGEMWKWSHAQDTLMITTGCTGRLLENVAEHELGHVLDLEHHPCDSYLSVMNECARVSHLTFHDRYSLKRGSYY